MITIDFRPPLTNLPGKFVAIEGIDGSGKTTLVHKVASELTQHGHEVFVCGGGYFEATKDVLRYVRSRHLIPSYTLGLAYALDYFMQMEFVIVPSLKEGKIVLSDRYIFSSFAYNLAYDIDVKWSQTVYRNSIKPDLTFFLDISPIMAFQRKQDLDPISKRFDRDFINFQSKVYHYFMEFSEYFIILPADNLQTWTSTVVSHIKRLISGDEKHE